MSNMSEAVTVIRELTDALDRARKVVGDRAAGGRMLTPQYIARDILDSIDVAQEHGRELLRQINPEEVR